ncbi:acyl-CoA dehydrogenase family protein [Nonomuraea wenchangensis]|uniref:Acyl-CoA dehydrogenase/oxidase C-terminal domain-containing protein n=1 Tax=Nonomuraea wenchangensis TaxID=568860 RepID=A0A1I0LBG8_9ACTN|nr:acyl-CoA dehydrogenase [Nonomuraea wenchangensis]SEU37489.1 hypothetical protein SAMN05421811_114223 [Nonomuraea wenchangensis]
MDFRLDETAETLGDLTGQILGRELPDTIIASSECESDGYSRSAWQGLVEAGVPEAFLTATLGGADADHTVLAAVLRQVAVYGGLVPALPVLAFGLQSLARYGGEPHRDLMVRAAKGQALVTGALCEPGGRRVADAATRAERIPGGFRLSGVKNFVRFGEEAEAILVPARVGDGEVGIFVVPAGLDGLTPAEHPVPDHVPTARVGLDAVTVPEHALLGEGERVAEAAEHFELTALLGLCATASGLLERAMTLTAGHIRTRKQFGRALAEFQAVTMQIADVFVAHRTLENSCLAAAWQLSTGRTLQARRSLSAAAYLVCHDLVPALFTCQHLHGGTGLDLDHPLHRYFTGGLAIGQILGGTEACLDAAAGRAWAS